MRGDEDHVQARDTGLENTGPVVEASMKAAIEQTDYLGRFVEVIFYDEGWNGAVTIYDLRGQFGGERHELDPGIEVPQDWRLRIPIDAFEALIDQGIERKLGSNKLDTRILAAYDKEQERVDAMLGYLMGKS
jgi:hypothetical protein